MRAEDVRLNANRAVYVEKFDKCKVTGFPDYHKGTVLNEVLWNANI